MADDAEVGEIWANIFEENFFHHSLPSKSHPSTQPLLLHSLIHSPPTHSLTLLPSSLSSLFPSLSHHSSLPPSCPLPTTRTPTRTAPRLLMQSSGKPLTTGT